MVFFSSCKVTPKLFGNVIIISGKQQQCVAIQAFSQRSISSKALRQGLPAQQKPAPFPYKEKRYNFLRALFDPTTSRLDENSKLIVVEGPPAAGKGALAKELADELGMAYFKAPTQADSYINAYGFDLRKLDHKLPESCQSYDETDFLKDPLKHDGAKAARFQIMKFYLRYKSYLDALAHILNTGQGVVMDRSPYSDFVYANAMVETGIIKKSVLNYYNRIRKTTLPSIWRPHLVVYLDVPATEVRRRIETRNRPFEKDSKVSTPAYLQSIEDSYKKSFLKDMSDHAEVLVYDWTTACDSEIVVEDIERLDFEKYGVYDSKMKDWRRYDKWDWNTHRHKFTHEQEIMLGKFDAIAFDCPDILVSGSDYKIFDTVISEAPGNKFAKGFNADMGDKGLLFKLS